MQRENDGIRMNKMGMVGSYNNPHFMAVSRYYDPNPNDGSDPLTSPIIQVSRCPGINPLARLKKNQLSLR